MLDQSLILASTSPQRRELIARLEIPVEVVSPPFPEPAERPDGLEPARWAERVAAFKAETTAATRPGRWVLGADTIVVCGGEIFGKPRDEADARRMLTRQAGQPSDVITGLCLLQSATNRFVRHAVTRVWMRDDEALRAAYVASDDWRGKAGGYGIQSGGDELVERWEGSLSNVVGLPLGLTASLLRSAGFAPRDYSPLD